MHMTTYVLHVLAESLCITLIVLVEVQIFLCSDQNEAMFCVATAINLLLAHLFVVTSQRNSMTSRLRTQQASRFSRASFLSSPGHCCVCACAVSTSPAHSLSLNIFLVSRCFYCNCVLLCRVAASVLCVLALQALSMSPSLTRLAIFTIFSYCRNAALHDPFVELNEKVPF